MRSKPILALAFVLAAAPLAAEDDTITLFGIQVPVRAGDPPSDTFGGNLNQTVIQVSDWQEVDSTTTWQHPQPGYLNATSPGMFVYAPLRLDNGVEVTRVCLEILDSNAAAGVTLIVAGFESGGAAVGPVFVPFEIVSTTGPETPGLTRLCADVNPTITIRSTADLNGAGGAHTAQYWVGAQQPQGPTTAVGPAIVSWRRTVSPAPPAATFSDVPTGNPFFRFVEALAASGITGGCGGGNYCPDNPVTRGQMAVFLAVSLGLYWPN